MKCSMCNRPAITFIRRVKKYFCEEHFSQFVLKQVRRYLEKHGIRRKKILIAVSGGKDSMVMLHTLKMLSEDFKLDITPFYINLGITGYSDPCESVVREVSEELELTPIIISLREYAGYTIDDAARIETKKPCSTCGTVKRYITNRIAYERGYDYVATGHTMIDEFAFALHNLYSGSIDTFLRSYEITDTRKDLKLVGRIKPLYYLLESETLTYAIVNKIKYCNLECPYAQGHPTQVHKEIGLMGEYRLQGYVQRILSSLNKLKEVIPEKPDNNNIRFCKICGYPTVTDICKYCRLKAKFSRE
ncbi:MAG: adenine nucleotide alpha hydrolase family protein [Euryarchaeota archaeon]|nr:adenine nucleotide alpha hydrolase family protein [Euryarchaeota archaeon]